MSLYIQKVKIQGPKGRLWH